MFHSRTQFILCGALLLFGVLPQANATVSGESRREPEVTLLLGCGLIAIGLLHRKRKAP